MNSMRTRTAQLARGNAWCKLSATGMDFGFEASVEEGFFLLQALGNLRMAQNPTRRLEGAANKNPAGLRACAIKPAGAKKPAGRRAGAKKNSRAFIQARLRISEIYR
jgi:hypothetical protein